MITVLSTGLNVPTDYREKCLASVAEQTADHEHIYLDSPEAHFSKLTRIIRELPDDRIVVSLDGDDWLAGPTALATVQGYYDGGALVTFGSFVHAVGLDGCGCPGFSAPYGPEEDIRKAPWRATHLKTFLAGMFKRIRPVDLREREGDWLPFARDLALMFPLLEMAGPLAVHVPEVVYVYNHANSTDVIGTEEDKAAERRCVAYVRGLPKYGRIAS